MLMGSRSSIPFDRIQGWFFDLDGTLMDTDDQTVDKLAVRIRGLGPSASRRFARWLVMTSETPGNAALTVMDALRLDRMVFQVKDRLSQGTAPTFRLIDGVTPLLVNLARDARLAIVSTRTQGAAQAFLEQHTLVALFDLVVTQETTDRLKPHPEPILYAAETLGLAPDTCVMVGDTPVDIRSARRAGAWAVGVLCGFGREAELRRAGAHLIVPSTADLLDLLRIGEQAT